RGPAGMAQRGLGDGRGGGFAGPSRDRAMVSGHGRAGPGRVVPGPEVPRDLADQGPPRREGDGRRLVRAGVFHDALPPAQALAPPVHELLLGPPRRQDGPRVAVAGLPLPDAAGFRVALAAMAGGPLA